jgi:hypothetical protein
VENKEVHGFRGTVTPITKIGTISWWIDDDNGIARNITIPNSYLVPSAHTRLLSPQHWAQQYVYNQPEHKGITYITTGTSIS